MTQETTFIPETLRRPEVTVRFHHVDKWINFIQKWLGVDPEVEDFKAMGVYDDLLEDGYFDNRPIMESHQYPWEYENEQEFNRDAKVFAYKEALDHVEAQLSNYERFTQRAAVMEEMIETLGVFARDGKTGELEVFLQSYRLLADSVPEYGSLKSVRFLSSDELSYLNDAIVTQDSEKIEKFMDESIYIVKNKILSYKQERDRATGYLASELDSDINKLEQVLPKLEQMSVLFETLFSQQDLKMLYSKLLNSLGRFFNDDDLFLLQRREILEGLASNELFSKVCSDILDQARYQLNYVIDLIGDDHTESSPLLQATLNKNFLSRLKFLRAAHNNPDQKVIFSHKPDQICESCRGGEHSVGEHCLTERVDTSGNPIDGADEYDCEALVLLFTSEEISEDIKQQVNIIRDQNGTVIEVHMPIHLYFDLELMAKLEKICDEVYSRHWKESHTD